MTWGSWSDNVLEGSDLPAIFCRALRFASRHEVPCSVGVFQGERSIKKKKTEFKIHLKILQTFLKYLHFNFECNK